MLVFPVRQGQAGRPETGSGGRVCVCVCVKNIRIFALCHRSYTPGSFLGFGSTLNLAVIS